MPTGNERSRFKPGNTYGKGRPKGAKGKLTLQVREAILRAFEQVGGQSYLATVAENHPQVFCALLGKILPTQVAMSDVDGEPMTEITVKFVHD